MITLGRIRLRLFYFLEYIILPCFVFAVFHICLYYMTEFLIHVQHIFGINSFLGRKKNQGS
ncbi:hypothetical protein ANAPC5_01371 [Anaplasma phagocytophilum]|nr:hypothetical protein ANAPC5_01371 [Anaplasma phagocytophilum]